MLDGAQGEELSAGRAARQWMLEMEGVEFTDLDAVCTCMAQKLVANGSYNAGLIDFETFWDVAVSCGAQLPQPEQKKAWLAVVTSPVNCRQGPGIEYDVIGIYPDSTQLIVESLGDTDGFYPAFDLNQGLKGWVHRDYVEILQEISYQTDGVLNPVGDVLSDNAWVQVKNDAGCSISVRFDQGPSAEFVKLEKGQQGEMALRPGQYRLVASTATPSDVRPFIVLEQLEAGVQYEWVFYIISR